MDHHGETPVRERATWQKVDSAGDPDRHSAGSGVPFTSTYRTEAARWWKGALSILVVLGGVFVLTTAGTVTVTIVEVMTGARDGDTVLAGKISMSPALLLATNLSLAAAGGLAVLAHRFVSGVRFRYLSSVGPGFRWRWAGTSAAMVVPLYLAYALLGFLDPTYRDVGFTAHTVAFVVVILATTPLQAAAEEYIFRGVIQRAAGSWFRSPAWSLAVGTVVSAALFSVAHLAADPWLIGYYFLFGVGLSLLSQGTGGVESGIVIHAANNVFLLIVAALAGEMDAGFDRSAGVGGPVLLLPLLLLAIIVALLTWMAHRGGVRRLTA